jgi:CO/xanthine dehydrogenase FAD-binding subunit
MRVYRPTFLGEVFDALDDAPGARLLAGGTDAMVEVNAGHSRPAGFVCLRDVPELQGWRRDGADVVVGAGCTYRALMMPEAADLLPAMAQASRTVGSPQIRNAGTIGGNLGTASPAGDTLPVLAALDARVRVASRSGTRDLDLGELIVGPKRTTLRPGEVIFSVRMPAALGTQEFLKVGTRNAMVIAVAGVALVVDWVGRTVRCALGSVGPVMIRAGEAESFAAGQIDWQSRTLSGGSRDLDEFMSLVRSAARPIDDHRSTEAYRRHAVGICARRALERALARGVEARREGEQWAS